MSDENFVNLSAGADVLIVEDDRRRCHVEFAKFAPESFLDLRGQTSAFWKKFTKTGKTVAKIGCCRWPKRKFFDCAGNRIAAFGNDSARTTTCETADLVGDALLACWDLGHRRDGEIAEAGLSVSAWSEGSERPGRTFVVHQSTGVIDRIDNAGEPDLFRRNCFGENSGFRFVDSFHDEFDGPIGGPFFLEPGENRLFAQLVDSVDRVGGGFGCDVGEIRGQTAISGIGDKLADRVAELAEETSGCFDFVGSHERSSADSGRLIFRT